MNKTLDGGTLIGIALVVILLFVNAGLTLRNTQQLDEDARWVARTHEVLDLTSDVLITLMNAETGQRGFLVTSKDEYLVPYQKAMAHWEASMANLKNKTQDNPQQQDRIGQLESMSADEFAFLKRGIDLRRNKVKLQQLLDVANAARKQMDAIQRVVADMRAEETELLAQRQQRTANAYRFAMATEMVTTTMGLVVVGAFVWALQRNLRIRDKAAAAMKEQREWLRTTVSSIGDGVISTDKDGKVTLFNIVAQTLTGWSPEEAQGQPLEVVFKIINEKTRAPAANPVQRVLNTGAVAGLANHTVLIAKDGTERAIDDCAAPIRNDKGKVIGVVMVFRDVTERRRTEEALQEADRRKTEFLAMLAHELRNPLAPIRNALQIMRLPGGDGQDLRSVREMMERQVGHMVRLVDDLLDVSRITRGNFELRKARVAIAQAVESALETTRPLVDAAKHELTVSMPPQPLWVHADLMRLAQVISNLLSNAIKYTPEGGHIRLTVESEPGEAILRVRDNGMGIPADMLARVFDMFTQVDRTVERTQGGLGIGLTLVRRLVQMHGGTVEAHSAGPDKGSEFIVRMPLAESAASNEHCPDSDGTAEEGVKTPRRRILVVDDNVDSAESLGLLLKMMENEVRTAYDGPNALEVAKAFRPEIVLLDIGLPGMSGYEVARTMRLLPELKNVLLVAQTGWGQDEDRRRSRDAGFDAHLVKPVDRTALQKLLSRFANQS